MFTGVWMVSGTLMVVKKSYGLKFKNICVLVVKRNPADRS